MKYLECPKCQCTQIDYEENGIQRTPVSFDENGNLVKHYEESEFMQRRETGYTCFDCDHYTRSLFDFTKETE